MITSEARAVTSHSGLTQTMEEVRTLPAATTQQAPNVVNFAEPAPQPAPPATPPISDVLGIITTSLVQLVTLMQTVLQSLQSLVQSNAAILAQLASTSTTEPTAPPEPRTEIDFSTIVPGEGENATFFENGVYKQNAPVDDSYLLEHEKAGLRAAVEDPELNSLPFWKNNFSNTEDIYTFFTALGNLESAGGRVVENPNDATGGDNGGSSGPFHLHNMYGFQEYSWGGTPVNKSDYQPGVHETDFKAYAELVMKNINANYMQSRHTINNEPFEAILASTEQNPINEQEIFSSAVGIWWTGDEENSLAGDYYLEALTNFKGVEDNTGSGLALRNREALLSGGINDNDQAPVVIPEGYGQYDRVINDSDAPQN